MKKLHLLCNAHLDPVWQWEWEEGAAAAISTFRAAAQLCEEFDSFIFNHNEAILYQWIEEYEPHLFDKIQSLVKSGKWHIIGGWFLQPDCNMPSGESFVRQILLGRKYFTEKFGVEPTTAVNFDSFGHTRGLVQILRKSGYDTYIFMRPDKIDAQLPAREFLWVGYDGSEVLAHKIWEGYNTPLGEADQKIKRWLAEYGDCKLALVTWGVGNHGGGPSRIDLANIGQLMKETESHHIIHSTPEDYFRELKKSGIEIRRYDKDLNPCFVGCYTSQIRIKQKHRLLENELYSLEKMLSTASIQGYMRYPEAEINEAFTDLMTSEFHDILPGSSVKNVEETSLRIIDHGLEIASRLKARAFFALASGQKKAGDGETPIMIYNPHPFKVNGIFECEFMLPDQNWKEEYSVPVVYHDGRVIPSQPEKELSNINLDWRKRVAFAAELEPSQMNRFDCRIRVLNRRPEHSVIEKDGYILFKTTELETVINCKTGLMDKYIVDGFDYIKPFSFLPVVVDDNDDSWGTNVDSFRDVTGQFRLMTREEGIEFSGTHEKLLGPVRVVEDGAVRTVVEALFCYHHSYLCLRYKLPKKGTEIQVQVKVNWNENGKMLKLSVPTTLTTAKYLGQAAYGTDLLADDGNETVAQKWTAVISEMDDRAFTCINEGTYGSDYSNGEVRLSLLRSPGYCALPVLDRPILPQDRYSDRMDQGERIFNFRFNAGNLKQRLEVIDREALVHNEKPAVLCFSPSGEGPKPKPGIVLSDHSILLTAFKKCEDSKDYIIRLFEPTGKEKDAAVRIPALDLCQTVKLGRFEIKTLKLDMTARTLTETDLLER